MLVIHRRRPHLVSGGSHASWFGAAFLHTFAAVGKSMSVVFEECAKNTYIFDVQILR
jgi:hypothetical protein